MRKLATLAIVWLIGGCGNRADDTPTPIVRPPVPVADAIAIAETPHDAAPEVDAAPIDRIGTPEELWNSYRAVIATATPRNFPETGRKLWPLLAKEARDELRRVTLELIARSRTKVTIPVDELELRLLGESVWSHAYLYREAELRDVSPIPNSTQVELSVYRPNVPFLHFTAVPEGSSWRLGPWPRFVTVKVLDAVLREPAGREAPTGSASIEQVGQRWKDVLEKGTGWDAYNLLSSATRARLKPELAQDLVGEIVAALDKTIVDRRTRGIHVDKVVIEGATADRATLAMTYSDGQTDRFATVRADGAWWLVLPI